MILGSSPRLASLMSGDQNHAVPLRVDAVAKRFGAVTAVTGVSFEIQAGACFGLLGPNGAGKSTLIRSIVGRVRLDSGSIRIFGHPVSSTAARADLGWVPQELAVYPLLTCRENLQAFGKYEGLHGKVLDDAIAWCLEWAALADRAGSPVKTLSGGMKRRLNMAAGLIHRPRLVLLDEPTVGVDPQSRNRIFEMVEALRANGTTIIYTTHYMEEAERLCDRVAIMDHGKIIALGTPQQLIASVGGVHIVEFAVSGHTSSTGRIDIEPLTAIPGVQSHRVDASVHQLSVSELHTAVPRIIDALGAQGLHLTELRTHSATLEDVFVRLTGRNLRDE